MFVVFNPRILCLHTKIEVKPRQEVNDLSMDMPHKGTFLPFVPHTPTPQFSICWIVEPKGKKLYHIDKEDKYLTDERADRDNFAVEFAHIF